LNCWIERFLLALLAIAPQVVTAGDASRTAYRDCAECPEMIVLPAGRFVMGIAPSEEVREQLADEFRGRSEPARTVTIRRFAVGRFEVTRGQYRAFIEATRHRGDGCFAWKDGAFVLDGERSWRSPGFPQTDDHPVTCVSWEDASAYVSWLTRHTGRKHRLPTEAEWEYAARAGSTAPRFWGEDAARLCEYANGADVTTASQIPAARDWPSARCNDGHAYTAPVGSYRANAFGLHDMLGNVGEWTQDCWNATYKGLPVDGSAASGGECGMRAVRGGSWDDAPVGLRSAYRVGSPTTVRLYSRGFRVAADVAQQ
jgi:formylglycine-generating enzyme